MDLPADPGPVEQGGSLLLSCDQFDIELVNQIANLLLSGLATVCVHNTTGLLKVPAAVAVEMRRGMVVHLMERSETYLAEAAARGDGNPDPVEENCKDPTEIISDFIDDFTNSRRSVHSRVSGRLMDENKRGKIMEFLRAMRVDGFWLMDERKAIAQALLRNLDFRNRFRCPMTFDTARQLAEHRSQCCFRPLICTKPGCTATFSAIRAEKHDSVCPSKVLPCRQHCSENVLRRDMESHCSTVCPMTVVNCPFHRVGCQSAIPRCTIEQHNSDFIHPHLHYVLETVRKQEISVEDVKKRVQVLEESLSEFLKTLDVQSLTQRLEEQEEKTKKLEDELSKSQSTINEQKAKVRKLERELNKVRQNPNPA
ncbi:TNF receptor-associated factor family protein [Cocos nucifera]|nr:TNF receptor-associated factor family protein [Cocos nucifera]